VGDFSKSEDWLALLEHTLDVILHPSPSKILQTFEEWDYQHRLRPQLYTLRRMRLLEQNAKLADRSYQLTSYGRLQAMGGIDPVARWQRPWDGQWRMLIFDLPAHSSQPRLRLWRWLRGQKFGFLQRSAWITPDSFEESSVPLAQLNLRPESVTIFEGRPVAHVLDADLVRSSWDFEVINGNYSKVLDLAKRGHELASAERNPPREFRQWLSSERAAWVEALSWDPLLPEILLPPGYLGKEAAHLRESAYRELAKKVNQKSPKM
jgi:phenylacetic acid degradation operon negative regulatory protein